MSEGLVLRGRYRLTKRLGGGAMGSVWRAEDLVLNAPVAIKLIDPSIIESKDAIARFQREAQAAAAIRSTYVVQIFDHGVEGNIPFIAMEMLDGESLGARLDHAGRLPPADTLRVLSQVGQALIRAHASGIVHRDLKPDNIFLVREGAEDIAKVLDFGIAKRLGDLGRSGVQTQSGTIMGTPYYMSPEQATGKPVDQRADIWSFAVIAFQCLAGTLPFESETWGGLFQAICIDRPPVPSRIGPVPEGFDDWFAKATSRDINQRFQSVTDAVAELRAVCSGQDVRLLTTPLSEPTEVQAAVENSDFQHTAAPATVTIRGLSKRPTVRPAALVSGVLLLLVVGLFFGWRWVNQGPAEAASAMPDAASSQSAPLPVAPASAPAVEHIQPVPAPTPVADVAPAATPSALDIPASNDSKPKPTGPAIHHKATDMKVQSPKSQDKPAAAPSPVDTKTAPPAAAKPRQNDRVGF